MAGRSTVWIVWAEGVLLVRAAAVKMVCTEGVVLLWAAVCCVRIVCTGGVPLSLLSQGCTFSSVPKGSTEPGALAVDR